MAQELQLALLGNVEIRKDGVPIAAFSSGKALALLCYLAVTGRPHLRPALAGLLWGEMPEESAQHNLRKALTFLRATVGAHLSITRQAVAFHRGSPYWLDVQAFEAHLDEHARGAPVQCLEQALALYRGDFLEGFYVRQAPEFEAWMAAQRARLRELALQALHALSTHHSGRGAAGLETGIHYATRLLAMEPWREEGHRQLMLLLAASGQRGAALAQFEVCRRVLAEELGVEPGAETTSLYHDIRDGAVRPGALVVAAPGERPGQQPSPGAPLPPFLAAGALPPDRHPPLIARQRELDKLDALLRAALGGQGRVAFVTGEAGVGKTFLIQEFARRAQESHADLVVAGGNCDAYGGIGDPYLPFREIMALLTGDVEGRWAAGTLGTEPARRLWQLIPLAAQALATDGANLVDIFVPGPALVARARAVAPRGAPWLDRLEALASPQAAGRAQAGLPQAALFEQYAQVLSALAQGRPLLLLVDDLQWADGGSLSLLFHLGRRLASMGARRPAMGGSAGARILIVGAYRPGDLALGRDGREHPLRPVIGEFARAFGEMEIDLEQSEGRAFVDALLDAEPNQLGAGFRRALYRHTEGNPLFTVELLRAMQARGDLVQDEGGRWVEGRALDWQSLPARVEGIIGERVSRLPAAALETLRVASVEGEEFTAEVAARVRGTSDLETVKQLSSEIGKQHQLVRAQGSETLGPAGARSSRYRFRHALFQRYLYNTLDQAERTYLHQAVGDALRDLYAGQTDVVAGQLARHYREAGLKGLAIDYLLQAGERAMRVYAYQEAIALLGEGLALLGAEPETPARARRELALQLAWGNVMFVVKGFVAPEAAQAYSRALALCRDADAEQIPQFFPALWALCVYYASRAEHREALPLGAQLLRLAERASDQPLFMLQAHHANWTMLYSVGDLVLAHAHIEQCIALYDAQDAPSRAVRYGGHDAKLCGLLWGGPALWFLGYPEQALRRSREALAMARALGDAVSLAQTHKWVAALHQLRREPRAVQEHAEAAITVAVEHGLPTWEGWAGCLLGWALARQGQPQAGIAQMRRSMDTYRVTGGTVDTPHLLALLAEAHWAAGEGEEALGALAEALAMAEQTGERVYEAEMHRLRGELLLDMGRRGDGETRGHGDKEAGIKTEAQAEACFRRALEVARGQEARSLELRAAMSLSRLWAAQGRGAEAREMLAAIYGWFSEGWDTADLAEAGALLDALS